MKKLCGMLVVVAALMLLSTSAQAVPADDASQMDLLAAVSTSEGAIAPMSVDDLGSVRGEGTFEQFFDFPQLGRSFDKTFQFDTTTIHVVGVAGVGVTLTIDSPHIP
jgi:hypothetical protein